MKTEKMKRAAGMLLAAAVMASSVTPAFAAEEQSMELTVNKGDSYMMYIPSSQSITFGAVDTEIGNLRVTGDIGSAQKLQVSVSKTDFADTAGSADSFAFELWNEGAEFAGKEWNSEALSAGTGTTVPLTVHIPTSTWGTVGAGSYRAVVTFKAELAKQ